jgi:HK97 family phage major capsid protein
MRILSKLWELWLWLRLLTGAAVAPPAGGLAASFRPIGGGESDAAIKERLKELKVAAKTALDAATEAGLNASAKTIEVEAPDGSKVAAMVVEPEHKAAYDTAMGQFNELQPEIEKLEALLKGHEWGNQPGAPSVALDAAAIAEIMKNAGGHSRERKTLGRMFVESEEYQAAKAANVPHMQKAFEFKGTLPDPILRKDVYSTLPGGDAPWQSFGSIQTDPFVESPHRTQRIRDLFGVRNTSSPLLRYFRVLGYLAEGGATNAASTVGQRNEANDGFQSKPHTSLKFEPKIANAARIAHYELAHRDALTDEPQLRGIIDSELLYGLQIVEDAQILYGTGTGDDLEGILTVGGVQGFVLGTDGPAPSTDNIADALRRSMTLVTLAEFEATGVVMHPSDLENLELLRSDGDERFYLFAATIQAGGEPRVWRVPVVQSQAIVAGTALVGAFGLGAQLYDLEQANIRISDQHDKLFVENGIAILAEERLLVATKRPEAFVLCSNLA